MSRYKAKVGQKVIITNGDLNFDDKYKNGDVMKVKGHGVLFLLVNDEKGDEYALDESEYEVYEKEKPSLNYEPEEITITNEQKEAVTKWINMDGNLKSIIKHKTKHGFSSSAFSCFNELTIEQLVIAFLRPDKIKIKQEVKYETLNPVTALEQFRDGAEICFKKEEDEEWFKLVEENSISVLVDDRYKLAVKVNG